MSRTSPFASPALLAFLVVASFAPDAFSQDAASLARARERFREGAALEASGDWARALEAFKDVALVKSNANVRFNIAVCQEKLGDYVQAVGSYRLALTEASQSNSKDIEAAVHASLAALEPKIPVLFIQRGEGATVAEVTLDGKPLANPRIGVTFQINPGPHVVRATAPDHEPLTVEFTLAESERKTIGLRLAPAKQAGASPAPVHPEIAPPPPEAPKPRTGLKVGGFVVVGVGVAGLATAGVFQGLRGHAISELDRVCGSDRQSCPASAKSTRDAGATDATVSTAAFAAGLGAAAAGAALLVVAFRKPAPAGPSVGLSIAPSGASITGRF